MTDNTPEQFVRQTIDRCSNCDWCREYLEGISKLIGVPIGIVSVGPSREQTIVLKDVF